MGSSTSSTKLTMRRSEMAKVTIVIQDEGKSVNIKFDNETKGNEDKDGDTPAQQIGARLIDELRNIIEEMKDNGNTL